MPFTGSDLRSGNDVASPMNDINPNDIERIEIIKGAAAATLYGTEAAAGVIQIFTKSGHAGKPQWTLQTDSGFVHSLPFGPDPSTAPPDDTIPQMYRDSFPDRFAGLPARGVSRAGGTSSYLFIDPWLRNGAQNHYSVSVAGGGEALALLRVRRGDARRRRAAERQRGEEDRARQLLVHADRESVLLVEHVVHAGQDHQHAGRQQRARADAQRVPSRPQLRVGRSPGGRSNKLLNQEHHEQHQPSRRRAARSRGARRSTSSNRFTIGFDRAEIENRNLRPFGFVSAPQGILSDRFNAYQNLTLDYAGNYARQLVNALRATFSWGGQGVTTDTRETSAYGENFPGPGNPVVASARHDARLRVAAARRQRRRLRPGAVRSQESLFPHGRSPHRRQQRVRQKPRPSELIRR